MSGRKAVIGSLEVSFLLLLAAGCSGAGTWVPTPDVTVTAPVEEGYSLTLTSVAVTAGEAVEIRGEANLLTGQCLYTQLYLEEVLLDWWPVGKCFPVTEPEWQLSIPLGTEGAPEDLAPEGQYRLRVWWPGAPERVVDEFYFDLTPPPSEE